MRFLEKPSAWMLALIYIFGILGYTVIATIVQLITKPEFVLYSLMTLGFVLYGLIITNFILGIFWCTVFLAAYLLVVVTNQNK